jgi:E1A-binding protein p400
MRRDLKLQRCRGIVRSPSALPGLKPPTMFKPMPEPENVPEWVIHEDWALLQVCIVCFESCILLHMLQK